MTMAILKKSKRTAQTVLIQDVTQNEATGEPIENITKTAPSQKPMRGTKKQHKRLILEPLKAITQHYEELPTLEHIEAAPFEGEVPAEFYHERIHTPTFDKESLDRQIKEYQKKAHNELEKELEAIKDDYFQQLEQERNRVLDEAYEQGFQQGTSEGKQSLEQYTQDFFDAMNAIKAEKKDALIESKPEILTLALHIAEKITKDHLSDNPDSFQKIVDEAISKITDKDKVIIRVNPYDVATVRKNKDAILERINDIKILEIHDDTKIEQGGCLIETKMGYVDATLSIKLEALKKALFLTLEDEEAGL